MTYNSNGFRLVEEGGFIEGGEPDSVHRIWMYITNDTKVTVEGTGYFNDEIAKLKVGDIIFVAGDVDGTPWQVAYIVNSVTSNVGITAAANLTYNSKYVVNGSVPLTDGTYAIAIIPYAGTITKIWTALQGVITTNDAVLTFKLASTAITNGVVTIAQSGAAVGDIDSATPTAANAPTAGAVLMCVVSGTPGASKTAQVSVEITPS